MRARGDPCKHLGHEVVRGTVRGQLDRLGKQRIPVGMTRGVQFTKQSAAHIQQLGQARALDEKCVWVCTFRGGVVNRRGRVRVLSYRLHVNVLHEKILQVPLGRAQTHGKKCAPAMQAREILN